MHCLLETKSQTPPNLQSTKIPEAHTFASVKPLKTKTHQKFHISNKPKNTTNIDHSYISTVPPPTTTIFCTFKILLSLFPDIKTKTILQSKYKQQKTKKTSHKFFYIQTKTHAKCPIKPPYKLQMTG